MVKEFKKKLESLLLKLRFYELERQKRLKFTKRLPHETLI